MNKINIKKIIKIVIVCVIVIPIAHYFYKNIRYGHSPKTIGLYEVDLSIFKIVAPIRMCRIIGSYQNRRNILNDFNYIKDTIDFKYKYRISVWEFKDEERITLNKIMISQDRIIDPFENNYEVLSARSNFEKKVVYGCDFKESFNLKVDNGDTILNHYNGENYKGIFGPFRRILISDEETPQIFAINKSTSKPILIVIAKRMKSIYLIIISSKYNFDQEDMFDILNL